MYRTLAVVALLVLAGCNAPSNNAPAETDTVTPVAVPNTTATGGPGSLAPGVTGAGVVDSSRLARAHGRLLEATSYTVNQTLIRRYANGTVQARYVTRARFAAEPGRFRSTVRQADRDGEMLTVRRVRRFGDGEHAYIAETYDNQTKYRLVRYPDGDPRDPSSIYFRNLTNVAEIERLFTLVQTETVGTFREDGTKYIRVRSREPTTLPPLRNVTLTATISQRGLVRNWRVNYDVTRRGNLTATVFVRYDAIGTTTVDRPGWVNRVNETTTATDDET